MSYKKRVLFFAEPATLAHVARPVVLAGAWPASTKSASPPGAISVATSRPPG